MPFTIIGHFAQGLDDFFAKLGTFHDGLNLNEDMEETDGGIDNLSRLARDQQANVVNEHLRQLLRKNITKFLVKKKHK